MANESYEQLEDSGIWLPTAKGYKAVVVQLDGGMAFNLDMPSVEAAWELIADALKKNLSHIVVREPYFGQDNVLTREAMTKVMWIAPIYIDHEEIKAQKALAEQQAAAQRAGLSVVHPQRNGGTRRGR